MKNAKKYILGIFVGRAPLLFDCRVADTKSEVGPTHVNHQSSRHAPIDDCMHEIHVVDRHFSIEPDEAESLEFVAGPEEESYPEVHQPRSIHLLCRSLFFAPQGEGGPGDTRYCDTGKMHFLAPKNPRKNHMFLPKNILKFNPIFYGRENMFF